MSETDNPLKLLITEFADAFAAWLLPQPIQWIRPFNVEFPATPLRSDLLFEVLDENGRLQLLHHELQGRTSHKPMPYRELRCQLEAVHHPGQWQQILLALFDAENTAVILDLVRDLENGRGAEK